MRSSRPSRIPQHSSGAAWAASARSPSKTGLETRIPISHLCSMGGGEIIEGVLAGGERLDKALAQASGLSRERIKALIAEGRVSLDGNPAAQPSVKAPEGALFR